MDIWHWRWVEETVWSKYDLDMGRALSARSTRKITQRLHSTTVFYTGYQSFLSIPVPSTQAIDMRRVTDSILCGSFRLVTSLPTATCTIFPTRLGRFVFSYWWKFSGPAILVRWRHVTTTTSTHMNQKLLRWHQQLYLLILLTYLDSALVYFHDNSNVVTKDSLIAIWNKSTEDHVNAVFSNMQFGYYYRCDLILNAAYFYMLANIIDPGNWALAFGWGKVVH